MRYHVESSSYQAIWKRILDELSSPIVLQSIFVSLFYSIRPVSPLDSSPPTRCLVKSEATLLRAIMGDLSPKNRGLWDVVIGASQIRDSGEGRARVLACWVAFSTKDDTDSSGKPWWGTCGFTDA